MSPPSPARWSGRHVRLSVLARLDLEWELGEPARAEAGTGVLFRHYGFGDGYPEIDLGHTAQTWALVLDRLAKYVASGTPQPFPGPRRVMAGCRHGG